MDEGWEWKNGDDVEFTQWGGAAHVRWLPGKIVDDDVRAGGDEKMYAVQHWVGTLTTYDLFPASAIFPRGYHERVTVDYAKHTIPVSVREHGCHMCRMPATHKVGDQSGPANFHELTTRLCCSCMARAGMGCDLYPAH